MHKINEFKGDRSIIVYDNDSGAFFAETIAEDRIQSVIDEATQAWGEILPFPDAQPGPASQKSRKAG